MSNLPCPVPDEWRRLLAGENPSAEFDQLEAHLQSCDDCDRICRQLEQESDVEWMGEFRAALRSLPSLDETLPLQDTPTCGKHEPDEIPVGTRLGPYRVTRAIGRGGMGAVVAAEHELLHRRVAIKIPNARLAFDLEGRQRFLREARASSRLDHPNICRLHEIGQWGNRHYLVMHYIDGQNLAQWLHTHTPSPRESAQLVAAITRGVAHAHQAGIIHRDIKPANILIERDTGRPVLTDFGLAQRFDEQEPTLTAFGQLLGTPGYMAPEQASGKLAQIGPAADIFCLGVVLFEMLAGRPPFQGSAGEKIRAVQSEDVPSPRRWRRALPRDLDTICLRALRRDPAERYASATALADDLERFLAGEPILARPLTWWEKAKRMSHRRVGALLLSIVLVLCVSLSLLGMQLWRRHNIEQLTKAIQLELVDDQWNQNRIDSLDSLVARLRQLDAKHEWANPARIDQALETFVGEKISRTPRITPEAKTELDSWLRLLQQRQPQRAVRLQERLQQRLREWQVVEAWPEASPPRHPPPLLTLAAEPAGLTVQDGAARHPSQATDVAAAGQSASAVGSSQVYLVSQHVTGNVRVRLSCRRGWQMSGPIGATLRTSSGSRYDFHIAPERTRTPSPNADDAGQGSLTPRDWRLEISRNGVPLRREFFHPPSDWTPAETLTVTATMEDRRLEVQADNCPALVFDDLFALPNQAAGFQAGLLLPARVELVRYSVERQSTPATPTAMEQGDALFNRGQWSEALEQYRRHKNASLDAGTSSDEMTLKEALCLDALGQSREAAELLRSLHNTATSRVRAAALCRSWLIALRDNRLDEADVLFVELQRQQFVDLVRLIPEAERDALATRLFAKATGLQLYFLGPEDVEQLRRLHAMQAAKWSGLDHESIRIFQVARAYHAANLLQDGEEYLTAYFAAPRADFNSLNVDLFEEYAWILRLRGELRRATILTNNRLAMINSPNDPWRRLELELARQHAARQEWQEALRRIDVFLASPVARDRYFHYSSAYLMRGFCLRHLGRHDEALATWKAGLWPTWQASLPSEQERVELHGLPFQNAVLLAAVTETLTADELSHQLRSITQDASIPGLALAVPQMARRFAPLLQQSLRDPDALAEVEQLAFQQVPMATHIRSPLYIVFGELYRQEAGFTMWSAHERQEIRQFVDNSLRHYGDGRITLSHLLLALASWEGSLGAFGWEALEKQLPPDSKVVAATLLGFRLHKMQRPDDAQALWRVALRDLSADSALRERIAALAPDLVKEVP